MLKKNCWEFHQCGQEPGGAKVAELGVCPAAAETRVHGINGGINGGRVCWAISGTFCNGQVMGSFAAKINTCLDCEFFKLVRKEEGPYIHDTRKILYLLASYDRFYEKYK